MENKSNIHLRLYIMRLRLNDIINSDLFKKMSLHKNSRSINSDENNIYVDHKYLDCLKNNYKILDTYLNEFKDINLISTIPNALYYPQELDVYSGEAAFNLLEINVPLIEKECGIKFELIEI